MLKQLLNKNNLKNEFIKTDLFERKKSGIFKLTPSKTKHKLEIDKNVSNILINNTNKPDNNINQILENQYLVKNIYLINLENQHEKRILMKKKLDKIKLNVNIIDGVNGYENREFTKILEKNPQLKKLGALGIIKTYQKILDKYSDAELKKNPYHKILILEDDICFHKDFLKLISKYTIKECDIVHLGINYTNLDANLLDQMKTKELIYYNHNNIKTYHFIYGAYGIMYSFKFLLLLKKYIKKCYPIDVLYNKMVMEKKLKGCFFNNALVVPIVNTSTNMGFRNQDIFMKKIKQNPLDYDYFNLSVSFNDIYLDYLLGVKNRSDIMNYNSSEITGNELTKLIENNNNSFVFIITSLNNEEWIIKNLDSIRTQDYPFWRVIYYDDNSSDNTIKMVKEYILKYQLENRFTILENNIRNYQGYGRWISFHHCYDDEICVLLDGDDWLYDNYVLKKLNKLYCENNIKVSYGGMIYYIDEDTQTIVHIRSFPKEIIDNNDYQNYLWISTHLRTGKAELFKSIPLNYLKYNGEYIKCCTDWAEMFWILNKSKGAHLPNNFIGCVYNKKASLLYDSSYYNRDKNEEWKNYRSKVEIKYKSYNYNE